jgi:hypothetical protein
VAHAAAAVPMGSARPYTHRKGIAPDRAGPT